MNISCIISANRHDKSNFPVIIEQNIAGKAAENPGQVKDAAFEQANKQIVTPTQFT